MMEESVFTKFVKTVFIKQGGGRRRQRTNYKLALSLLLLLSLAAIARKTRAVLAPSLQPSRQQRATWQLGEKQQTAGPSLLILHHWGECYAPICLSLSSSPPRVKEQTGLSNNLTKKRIKSHPTQDASSEPCCFQRGAERGQNDSHQMLPHSCAVFSNDSYPGCHS